MFKRTKQHITFKPEEKDRFEAIVRSAESSRTEYERARIILMDAEGNAVNAIA
ncbi:MAG: hypothetical protein QXU18_16005 [Thermoplasmatales archaeon]